MVLESLSATGSSWTFVLGSALLTLGATILLAVVHRLWRQRRASTESERGLHVDVVESKAPVRATTDWAPLDAAVANLEQQVERLAAGLDLGRPNSRPAPLRDARPEVEEAAAGAGGLRGRPAETPEVVALKAMVAAGE